MKDTLLEFVIPILLLIIVLVGGLWLMSVNWDNRFNKANLDCINSGHTWVKTGDEWHCE